MNQTQNDIINAQIKASMDHDSHLEKVIKELKAELRGWHDIFKTPHLSHAITCKEALEFRSRSQNESNEWQVAKIKVLTEKLEALKSSSGYELGFSDGRKVCERRLREVEKQCEYLKYESDNQAAAWKEIRTFIPDVNGLSMVGMVRRHVEELEKENAALKSNNRFQRGYGQGYAAATDTMMAYLKSLPERG